MKKSVKYIYREITDKFTFILLIQEELLSKNEDIKLAKINNQINDQSKIPEDQEESEIIQLFLSNNDNSSKNLSALAKIRTEISADDVSKSKIKQNKSICLKRWLETVFCCSNCCLAYSKFQVSLKFYNGRSVFVTYAYACVFFAFAYVSLLHIC